MEILILQTAWIRNLTELRASLDRDGWGWLKQLGMRTQCAPLSLGLLVSKPELSSQLLLSFLQSVTSLPIPSQQLRCRVSGSTGRDALALANKGSVPRAHVRKLRDLVTDTSVDTALSLVLMLLRISDVLTCRSLNCYLWPICFLVSSLFINCVLA